jgi:hypothetical protein
MALGRAYSVAVRGLDGEIVEIEADITSGLPGVHLVGLADAALQESRDRVRSAITNSENQWPMARLTLALSPATLPKMGSVYDMAKGTLGLFYSPTTQGATMTTTPTNPYPVDSTFHACCNGIGKHAPHCVAPPAGAGFVDYWGSAGDDLVKEERRRLLAECTDVQLAIALLTTLWPGQRA